MTLEELEKRVKVLEDIEEIKQLHYRYVNSLTQCNWDDLLDCFAEEGATDFPEFGVSKGKAAVAKVFKEGIALEHIGEEAPYCIHPIISVEEDKAKGSWLLYIHGSLPHTPRQLPPDLAARFADTFGKQLPDWLQGYYDMEYVRENGIWKISRLKWSLRLKSPRGE
jgi:hypothetical protein